ncbi:reverse transcriptase domain-containing protein [Tanacetum coccineum]
MVTPLEKRSDSSKFCEFHNDKGHNTDEYVQLKKQIEELVRAGKLSQFVKGIRQEKDQQRPGKKDFPTKDKAAAIYMVQSWQRVTRQKVTRPSLTEAEIWGTTSTDVCDGGRSMEVLFERCFNRLRPEVQSQMAPATTLLTSFSRETIWPVGQIRLLVTVGDAEHSTEAWMNRYGSHGMIKFPVKGGVVTIRSTIVSSMECATVTVTPKNIEEKTKKCPENFQVAIHPDFPDQEISIGDTLSPKGERNNVTLKKKPRHIRMSPILTYSNGEEARWELEDVCRLYGPKQCPPQDCYPLPEIRLEIKSPVRSTLSKLSGPYKGYHQIQMAEEDEEKTAFHTPQGVYCYTKMPFGLKNAGATYQRLVDKAFDKLVGRNLKVYVDDLVIKSHTEEELLRDIEETFRTLRKINMKLNPKKCTFGAVEGMFLGYVVGPEGIKPCPDKVDDVLQLPSPRTIKEVQSLNGKLACLNRFISKSAEKSLPLFKTLKNCTKKSEFFWTSDAEKAFRELK